MKTAIIYDKWLSGMGGGEVVACNMAMCLRDCEYKVTIVSQEKVSPDEINSKFGIDITGIQLSTDQRFLLPTVYGQVSNLSLRQPDLFINISFMDYSYGIGERNIYYVHFPSKIRSGLFNYVLLLLLFIKKYFPKPYSLTPRSFQERIDDRLRAGIYPDMKKRLNSYDTFITHSEYVKRWVKKLWHKDAVVLYPPIKLVNPHALSLPNGLTCEPVYPEHSRRVNRKLNWITSIGRFFTLGHGKKQEILINAFKQLFNSLIREPVYPEHSRRVNPLTDLQLHLIGGVGSEPSSIRFVEKLKQLTKGYPIYFHFDASRQEVEEILCKSKVYWHAAGYGEDLEHDPIKFEHFGIAPIEAISAGCIPVLFNGGGLTEIIELLGYDRELHLFSTIDGLVEKTNKILMKDEKMVVDSKILNSYFSPSGFKDRFIKIIND